MPLTRFLLAASENLVPAGKILDFSPEFLVRTGIQWVNIGLIIFILAKVLYQPVKKFMEGRA
jgi:hypothetical protein